MTAEGVGVIAARRMGRFAARFFAEHSQAQIVAVFERSLYLQAGRSFVCLGDHRIGDGPINICVETKGDVGFIANSRAGDSVEFAGGIANAPVWRLDVRGAEIWTPASWPVLAAPEALGDVIAQVLVIVRSMLPVDGLLPFAHGDCGDLASNRAFQRLAGPRLERLENWLRGQFADDVDTVGEPPVDLLGFGPGLTPSGDDALCGVILALSAMRTERAAGTLGRLAEAVSRECAEATTALSAQFLSAAIEGQGSGVLHAFVVALVSGEMARIPAAMEKLSRVGHSSGLDAAAGVIIALRAFVAASHRSTRSL